MPQACQQFIVMLPAHEQCESCNVLHVPRPQLIIAIVVIVPRRELYPAFLRGVCPRQGAQKTEFYFSAHAQTQKGQDLVALPLH